MSSLLAAKIVVAGAAVAAVGLLADATLRPQSQLSGRTLVAGDDPAELALTYDDGPNDRATMQLLEVLARHKARATFFMIGQFVRQRPQLARAVHEAGHLVGNHTMTHPWLAWQSEAVIRKELRACNQALEDAVGAPVRYFRPPHGARRPAVLRIAQEFGLTTVEWNAQGQDWVQIPAETVLANVRRGMHRARSRNRAVNILLHDGYDRTMGADRDHSVLATDMLLRELDPATQRVVTVDAWG